MGKRREIKELIGKNLLLNNTYMSCSSVIVCIAKISCQSKICYFYYKVLCN